MTELFHFFHFEILAQKTFSGPETPGCFQRDGTPGLPTGRQDANHLLWS